MEDEFEVEAILDKRSDETGEFYLSKFINAKKTSWVPKTSLNCNVLLLEFEKSRGPNILGMRSAC